MRRPTPKTLVPAVLVAAILARRLGRTTALLADAEVLVR